MRFKAANRCYFLTLERERPDASQLQVTDVMTEAKGLKKTLMEKAQKRIRESDKWLLTWMTCYYYTLVLHTGKLNIFEF